MNLLKSLTSVALVVFAFASQSAVAATVTTSVDGTDNIYFTDWGSLNNGLSVDVIGRGTATTAVAGGSGAIDFSGLGPLMSIATGSVVDAGSTATDADGGTSLFNGLTVYSLIGVWSSTSGVITAIGDSFFVGSSETLAVPTVSSAYLFLGENDGIFSDNSGAYSVTIDYGMTVIPLPATLPLLAAGLGGLGWIARRKRKSA